MPTERFGDSTGAVIYNGPAFTVTGSTAYWYGGGVYNVV